LAVGLLLSSLLSAGTAKAAEVTQIRISASSDDAEEQASGSVSFTSSDLELVHKTTDQTVGMRFAGVNVPRGAMIINGFVQFQVDEADIGETLLKIQAEDTDDPPTFANSAGNISSRNTTATEVWWDPAPWTVVGEAGVDQQTPNIASILQDVVDRPGWRNGNALVLIITGAGTRVAESYDGDSIGAPLLYVEYIANEAPVAVIDAPVTDMTVTVGASVSFAATGTDPDGSLPLSFLWDFGGGSPNQTMEDPGGILFDMPGIYTVTLTVTDSFGLMDTDQVTVSVTTPGGNLPPAVSAGSDQTISLFGNAILDGTVSDDGLPVPPGTVLATWSQLSGPGTVTLTDPGALATTAGFSDKGTYLLELTVDDGEFAVSDQVAITVISGLIDIDPHPTPDVPRPGYRESIIDPVFKTYVTRITDAGQPIANPGGDPSLEGMVWGSEAGHGYSSRVAWNANQSLLMMEKGVSGSVFLDGTTYEPLFRRNPPGDVRWHPIDPEVQLYVNRDYHCLGAYEPRTDTGLWERCYGGYDSFGWSDPGKGKPSIDGNIIPVRAQRSSDKHWVAFLYYVDSDTRSGEIDMSQFAEPGDAPDFVMSPKGDTIIVVGCIEGHSGRCKAQVGIDVATEQELWRTNTYHDPGHADEAVDANGEQWRIGGSKEGTFDGHIIMRNFRTGEEVSLISYAGSHTSTRGILAARNMAIVTYHESSSDPPFKNEIVGVCLDGSCLERYAHTHRYDDLRYLGENHASISPWGDRIVFRSNWDQDQGPIDAYVIELGGGSSANLAPEVSITAPIPRRRSATASPLPAVRRIRRTTMAR
jgi:PKD repeat protein